MKYGSQTFYAALADTQGPGPAEHPKAYRMGAMGLADPKTASLRCFQRYSRNATRDITDGDGIVRWTTQKRARIAASVAMASLSPSGQTTMTAIAAECLCTVSTVSRTLTQLQRWGLYVVDIRRGRNGGITIHRPGWERFWESVWDLRRRLSTLRTNVASVLSRKTKGAKPAPGTVPVTSPSMDATFSRKAKSFGERVLYERAMLALEDPEGEYDAAHPITNVDEALLQAEDERRRRYAAVREAALAGDWERWEVLRQAWDVE